MHIVESDAHKRDVATSPSSDLFSPPVPGQPLPFGKIPLWGINDDGSCRCRKGTSCGDRGKHPKCDARRELLPYEEGDNWGILTGKEYGVIVNDIDVKKEDGFAQFEALKQGHVDATEPPETITPSGGAHLFFKHPGFHIGNGKLGGQSAIDVRGDKRSENGWAYVVGPGSRGVALDGTVTTYKRRDDVNEIPDVPNWQLGWLLQMQERRTRVGVSEATPMPKDHELYSARLAKGHEWAKVAEPSRGDGQGGTKLLNLCLRLVRTLELHDDDVHAIIEEHFNPRCTYPNGRKWLWSERQIQHKLDDARYDSAIPCGLSEGITDKMRSHSMAAKLEQLKANVAAHVEGKVPRKTQRDPEHKYTCKIGDAIPENAEACTQGAALNLLTTNVDWAGVFQYDLLRDCIRAVDPPIALEAESDPQGLTEEDITSVRFWFEKNGMLVGLDSAWAAVKKAAKLNAFNPLVDYYANLPPSEGAIEELYRKLGCDSPLERAYVRKTLISAVKRNISPGCKVDTMLTLLGAPGVHKSRFVPALFGQEWIAETLPPLDDEKRCGEVMAGKRAIEMSELAALTATKSRNAVISFMSRTVDTFRGSYARGNAKQHPRSCVFIGTTNDAEIFRDIHGADIRRLWVIEVRQRIDVDWIEQNRDRLWSEAYEALNDGEQHWLTPEEEKEHEERSKAYEASDDWSDAVEAFIRAKASVRVDEVWTGALQGELHALNSDKEKRIQKILKRLKWKSKASNGDRRWRPTMPPKEVPQNDAGRRRFGALASVPAINAK